MVRLAARPLHGYVSAVWQPDYILGKRMEALDDA